MKFLRQIFVDKGAFVTRTHDEVFYAGIFINAFLISFVLGKSENLPSLLSLMANNVDTSFFIWALYGLLAALMYRFGTDGPANPFASAKDSIEPCIFFVFVVSGPVGYIVSSFIFVRYQHIERKLRKEIIASWTYKPKKPVVKNPMDENLDDRARLLM